MDPYEHLPMPTEVEDLEEVLTRKINSETQQAGHIKMKAKL